MNTYFTYNESLCFYSYIHNETSSFFLSIFSTTLGIHPATRTNFRYYFECRRISEWDAPNDSRLQSLFLCILSYICAYNFLIYLKIKFFRIMYVAHVSLLARIQFLVQLLGHKLWASGCTFIFNNI